MDYSRLILFFAILMCVITGTHAATKCASPSKPEKHTTLITSDNNNYKKGEVVVWECDPGQGFGHVWVQCKANGDWTKPNKKCSDQVPFGYGTLFGLLCAVFTIVIEIVFVFFATRLVRQKQKDEDVELRIMEAANATPDESKK